MSKQADQEISATGGKHHLVPLVELAEATQALQLGSSTSSFVSLVGSKSPNVTVRVFNGGQGTDQRQIWMLHVDSPDDEHAVASTLASAALFTKKTAGSRPLPNAFTWSRVEPR